MRSADDSARVAPRDARRASARRVRASSALPQLAVRGRQRAWRRLSSMRTRFPLCARGARRRRWRSGDACSVSESRSSSASESIVGGTSRRIWLRLRDRDCDRPRSRRAARRPRAAQARANLSTRASSSAVSSSRCSGEMDSVRGGGALGVLSLPDDTVCVAERRGASPALTDIFCSLPAIADAVGLGGGARGMPVVLHIVRFAICHAQQHLRGGRVPPRWRHLEPIIVQPMWNSTPDWSLGLGVVASVLFFHLGRPFVLDSLRARPGIDAKLGQPQSSNTGPPKKLALNH